MRGLYEGAAEVGAFNLPDGDLKAAATSQFASLVDEYVRRLQEDYELWLLNQGLVSLCTIFDAFLEDFLNAVLYYRREILYGTAGSKNVELKEIAGLDSMEAVLAYFRMKEVNRFAFEDIGKRFAYLQTKAGFEIDRVFAFDGFETEAVADLSHWSPEYLTQIYAKRHEIVHRDGRPIRTIQELQEIYDGMSKIALGLSRQAVQAHSAVLDFVEDLSARLEVPTS